MSAASTGYKSGSQIARVITEPFVEQNAFCPSCGNSITAAIANSKVKDFECTNCPEEFELKSKKGKIGKIIPDGAYESMIDRINSMNNPSLYVLHYNEKEKVAENLFIVPRYFFTPNLILKRKPLSPTARRAGWVGCDILISQVPEIGRIHYLKNRVWENENEVLKNWKATEFLKKGKNLETRGWLLDTLNCVQRIHSDNFTLEDVYKFENDLRLLHPNNNFIKDKLRQQLQRLRDENIIEFVSPGKYRKVINHGRG